MNTGWGALVYVYYLFQSSGQGLPLNDNGQASVPQSPIGQHVPRVKSFYKLHTTHLLDSLILRSEEQGTQLFSPSTTEKLLDQGSIAYDHISSDNSLGIFTC